MGIIKNYTPPATEERYASDVTEVISLGLGTAYEVQADGLDSESVGREIRAYQKAVLAQGFSARVVERDDDSGTAILVLKPRRVRTAPESAKVESAVSE